jgi:hypothetical protein
LTWVAMVGWGQRHNLTLLNDFMDGPLGGYQCVEFVTANLAEAPQRIEPPLSIITRSSSCRSNWTLACRRYVIQAAAKDVTLRMTDPPASVHTPKWAKGSRIIEPITTPKIMRVFFMIFLPYQPARSFTSNGVPPSIRLESSRQQYLQLETSPLAFIRLIYPLHLPGLPLSVV